VDGMARNKEKISENLMKKIYKNRIDKSIKLEVKMIEISMSKLTMKKKKLMDLKVIMAIEM